MSASIIDGKELSARVRADLVTRIQAANRPVRLGKTQDWWPAGASPAWGERGGGGRRRGGGRGGGRRRRGGGGGGEEGKRGREEEE